MMYFRSSPFIVVTFISHVTKIVLAHSWTTARISTAYDHTTNSKRKNHEVIGGLDDIRPIYDDICMNDQLRSNPSLSSPVECARTCKDDEPPKTCYYHFTLELYTVMGTACTMCQPNATNTFCSNCQCVTADGVERGLLTANRMLPGPTIDVCEGDQVVIDVTNNIEGSEVTIHWHGIFQRGSQYFDGVPFITQCPIPEFNNFRYKWRANNAGTHFWHAHTGLQKLDGLFGGIIVRQPAAKDPNSHLYHYDLSTNIMLINDWMHSSSESHFPGLLHHRVGQLPETFLINGKGRYQDPVKGIKTNTSLQTYTVKQNKSYRFRLINSFCTTCPARITVENHTLTVIATDGVPIKPQIVNSIDSFAGERYDFIINTNLSVASYWIQLYGLGECADLKIQQLAILRYEGARLRSTHDAPTYDRNLPTGLILNAIDATCDPTQDNAVCITQLNSAVAVDREILKPHPDIKMFLPFQFYSYTPEEVFHPNTYHRYLVPGGGMTISLVDGISFVFPSSPPLSQFDDIPSKMLCNHTSKPPECTGKAHCSCTHLIDVPYNAIVEVVLIDEVQVSGLSHPFHLHGYAYNVVGMGRSSDKDVNKITMEHVKDLDERGLLNRNFSLPAYKDTIHVPTNGYVILRFRANNPGYWLLHCHFLYHIAIGMDVLIHVGDRSQLPPVPHNFPKCRNYQPPI